MRDRPALPVRAASGSNSTTRLGLGSALGAAAGLGAVSILVAGQQWPRVLIPHAWNLGAHVSRSTSSPNVLVVVAVAVVTGFALGYLAWPAFQARRRDERARTRLVATHLLLLYASTILILAAYPAIAGSIVEAVGGDGAVGPEYLIVFAIRLLPGAALFLIIATLGILWIGRKTPHRISAGVFLAWLSLALVTLASIAWYFSPLGPSPS